MGGAAAAVNSSWVELHASRGTETSHHKLLMRLSVVAADILVFIPAAFMFSSPSQRTVVTLLSYPGLIIIDHGHFQYNGISLGLALAAVALLTRGRHLLGAALFVAALNYKQMELYHALPFFFYLLGVCRQQRTVTQKLVKLVTIGVTVIVTFALIWAPFLQLGPASVVQVLRRIFPFDRGLFEDKVANFWCAADVVLKLRQRLAIPALARLCLGTTLLLSLPTNIHLFLHPTQRNFVLSLVNTSLIFFLFSFQVHEKSILLAAVPLCLLTYTEDARATVTRTVLPWLLTISTFSMLPLLAKDGLLLPGLALSVLHLTVTDNLEALSSIGRERPRSVSGSAPAPAPLPRVTLADSVLTASARASLLGCCVLVVVSEAVSPPAQYPFLWPLLVCVYSAGHFLLALGYFHYLQFSAAGEGGTKGAKKKTN